MTAIVAILNKSAAALSADSAVSVAAQTKKKVYNSANKVFNLAIGNPIGIMIYNNAEFLGIPWESLVKMYRKYSNNASMPTVTAYRDNFLKFLSTDAVKYFTGDEEDRTLSVIAKDVFMTTNNEVGLDLVKKFDLATPLDLQRKLQAMPLKERIELIGVHFKEKISATVAKLKSTDFCPGFDVKDIEFVRATHEKKLRKESGIILAGIGLVDKEFGDGLYEAIELTCVKQSLAQSFSGLVFSGFGEDEIFPAIASMQIGGYINGKIRYSPQLDEKITVKKPANIYPFAQTDIMETFIQGIDPQVSKNIPIFLEKALIELRDFVLKGIDGSTEEEKSMKENLDKTIPSVLQTVVNKLDRSRKRNHEDTMIATISTLSKEDLTAMAESLIHTTSLHKRASFSEESVGGPVDVAVITKGDGFIWIKRKHYFDAALNLSYTKRV